jgi:5-bromo-4-chloroindolyl phosphate hydrolysis protein
VSGEIKDMEDTIINVISFIITVLFFYFIGRLIVKGIRKLAGGVKKEVPKVQKTKDITASYKEAGLTDNDIKIFRDVMGKTRENIIAWDKHVKANQDLQLIEEVTTGLESSKKMFKYIVNHPKELNINQSFLYNDLPAMRKLTGKYLELAGTRQTDAHKEALATIKALSTKIAKCYQSAIVDDIKEIRSEIVL